MMPFAELIQAQRNFFDSNQTKEIEFRIEQLKKLKQRLTDNESFLYQAIFDDFGKSQFETYITEVSVLHQEIDLALKNLKQWSKRQKVATNLTNFPAKSYLIPEPLGVTLIIGAWNYPFHLSLLPAISALAAGNTVIIKPSELPKKSSAVMAKLINNAFSADYLRVIEGGIKETTELLEQRFDKIFFTGSQAIGKLVYQAAAKHLTPVTLELGGKNPTFIFKGCDLKLVAKRLVWAKFINAGQTCVAPDYVLVEKSIETELLEAIKQELINRPRQWIDSISGDSVQIINQHHFDRLEALISLSKDKIYCGGKTEGAKRAIQPTLVQNVTFDDALMQEEIFGPILPVLAFENLDSIIDQIKQKPKPLACYIYSINSQTINRILQNLSFGGGCINDSVMHLSNNRLPFGGVGLSGFGSYHGKAGFDCFTHYKSILHKPCRFELNLKYPPYSKRKLAFIKWLLRLSE